MKSRPALQNSLKMRPVLVLLLLPSRAARSRSLCSGPRRSIEWPFMKSRACKGRQHWNCCVPEKRRVNVVAPSRCMSRRVNARQARECSSCRLRPCHGRMIVPNGLAAHHKRKTPHHPRLQAFAAAASPEPKKLRMLCDDTAEELPCRGRS